MANRAKRHGRKGCERNKGAGTLERRPSGLYVARWMADGVRYSQSTGTKDRGEAEKALADFTAVFRLKSEAERLDAMRGRAEGVRRRIRELEKERPTLALADMWDAYLDAPERSHRIGAHKLAIYEGMAARFVAFVGRKFPDVREMREIGRSQVTAFLDEIKGLSADTINKYIGLLRRIWAALAESENAGLTDNPWEKVRRRRVESFSRRALTPIELNRVCGRVKGEMRILFAVGIYTGLRLGDCATLKWGDVDMARRMVCVIPRKTAHSSGASVTIPMHSALYMMLSEIPPESRTGFVMPGIAAKYESGKAKCVVSFALQENFGFGVQGAVALGCVPVAPDRLAYAEQFDRRYRYCSFPECVVLVKAALDGSLPAPERENGNERIFDAWFRGLGGQG